MESRYVATHIDGAEAPASIPLPAAVVVHVDREAPDEEAGVGRAAVALLHSFARDAYPSPEGEGAAERLYAYGVDWHLGAMFVGSFLVAVFPRAGLPSLAARCRGAGLVLMQGVITLFGDGGARVELDLAAALGPLGACVPERTHIYTIEPVDPARPEDQEDIAHGLHEHELPAFLRRPAELDS